MRRSRSLALIAVVGLALLSGAFLWALPEIARRVAVDRISKRTGRAAAIGDIDLNPFTGHLAIKGFRLADREGSEPLMEFERFDIRLGLLDLLRSHVRVREVTLVAPTIRVVRLGPAEFNFSDLLAGTGEPVRESTPSRWTGTVERLDILRGRVQLHDRAVAPPVEWLVQELDVEARSLTTRPGAAPGQLSVRAKIDEAQLAVRADPFRLDPLRVEGRLSFEGSTEHRLDSYLYIPLGAPYRPKGGRLGLALTADVDSDAEGIRKAMLSGTVSLAGESLTRVGRPDPFVSVSRLGLEIKEADLVARTLTVGRVDIEGLDLTARRDARGVIDLLAMFTPKRSATRRTPPPPGSPAPPAVPPGRPARRTLFPIVQGLAHGFDQIRVERITLAPSRAVFVDDHTKPTTRLALTKLQARVDDLTWPVRGPATVAVSTGLPGGGTLDVKGPVTLQPFDAELTVAVRNAPVEPYQAYITIPARLSGRYGGDSKNRIAIRDGGLVAQSKGDSWADSVEIREPGAERPAIRVERMELVGIDFDWAKRAAVARASFRRPRLEVERAPDGSINLRRLFTAPGPEVAAPTAASPAKPDAAPSGPKPKGLLETLRLEFREVRVDDGFVRFLDRTTQPAFSQDLSRLALTVTDLGNRPDRRAKLTLQSVVGGDAGLDVRGEIGPLGAPALIDLVGELRSFKLPSVDPYASTAVGWVIKRGELQYKVHFKLDGGQLSADNDVVIGQLQVTPARGGDEVKRRIGLPLDLIVALIKDQHGDIRASVPVTGAVNDPKFALGDAIWTAIKNVLVNIVSAPFKAIGRLFSSGEKVEEPRVDPVTFAAGSSVLSPAMEDHLVRVADFLRRSPFVNLALASAPSRADVDALKSDAVAARLEAFRKERGAPDAAAALAEYYAERLPDVPLPATVEEQVALLREREPAPDTLLADLGRRRVEATRERLLEAEGIPEARLTAPEGLPVPSEATGEGRVEFAIVAGE